MSDKTCFEEALEKKRLFRRNSDYFDLAIAVPYEAKLALCRKLVENAIAIHGEHLVVACSFGKDSLMVVHLAIQVDPSVKVVFSNTGVEFRESLELRDRIVEEWDLNYVEAKPETTFWKIVKKHGYPGLRFWSKSKFKVSEKDKSGEPRCCYHLKKKPVNKLMKEHDIRAMMLGITFDESYQRRYTTIRFGQVYRTTKSMPREIEKIHPIVYMSTEEVWRYTRDQNLPVNEAYAKYGIPRVGCTPCTGYKSWQTEMPKHHFRMYMKIAADQGKPPLEFFDGKD